LLKINTIRKS